MILPTKHVAPTRSLLGLGADVLRVLDRPMTVSMTWTAFRERGAPAPAGHASFGAFVLALDLLYLLGVIDLRDGKLVRAVSQ